MSLKKKILIVDDIVANLHLTSAMLKDNFTIVVAKDGFKALELCAKQNQPDLVLLDIQMPQMDGFEVAQRLRADSDTKNIPIIFISGDHKTQYENSKILQLANDYIAKPFDKEQLHIAINRVLQSTQSNINITKGSHMYNTDNKSKVLIVDDAPENITIAIEILKDEYSVTVATSAKKGFEILEQNQNIDLILLDVMMPLMDGFQMCKLIKTNPKLCHIPIIFLTVLEDEKDILKGIELGAVDYVTKPFEPKILKARVGAHIKLKKYQDQLLQQLNEKDEILIQQSKLASLGELFEAIIHQWKQPLSSISLCNANIRVEQEFKTLTAEKLSSMLDEIDDSTKHLAETLDVFRDFLNNETTKSLTLLQNLIDKTLKIISSKLRNRSIELKLDVDNIEIFTLQNDLIQVLMNIITNAMHAFENNQSIQKRVIQIKAHKQSDSIHIQICDNAGGIQEENLEKIFEKYFTTKDEKKGSGLGLYICKKILENKLEGNIVAKNIPNGACFTITIPQNQQKGIL
ncbi:MAG: response regulator [Campylobacterales bacterium]|nr:response regulator [Campylobacterales bacterium]